jgi:D-sedoheptulose 7-phosphate isomerase
MEKYMTSQSENSIFRINIKEHKKVLEELISLEPSIEEAVSLIADSIKNGGKLIICGNGGSASDAQHMSAEFTGRFLKDREPIPAISLNTDTSAITCIANDYSYDEIFSRQLKAIGKKGDCLIAITTSGNSSNVINCVDMATNMGIPSITLSGKGGGKLFGLASLEIIVNSNSTARIQEMHILILHTICEGVEIKLGYVE